MRKLERESIKICSKGGEVTSRDEPIKTKIRTISVKQVFIEYLNIVAKQSNISKGKRKQQHEQLMQWVKKDYTEDIPFDSVIAFMKEHLDLDYNKPFYQKLLAPCIENEIQNGNALRFMFESTDQEKDFIDRAPVELKWRKCISDSTLYKIAEMVLLQEPDNCKALYYLYERKKASLECSIHEVPAGILSANSGAREEDLDELIQELNSFKKICSQINKNESALIGKCETYYRAWNVYLNNIKEYTGFEDYLNKHDIDY